MFYKALRPEAVGSNFTVVSVNGNSISFSDSCCKRFELFPQAVRTTRQSPRPQQRQISTLRYVGSSLVTLVEFGSDDILSMHLG